MATGRSFTGHFSDGGVHRQEWRGSDHEVLLGDGTAGNNSFTLEQQDEHRPLPLGK